jgi:hypothetical protein
MWDADPGPTIPSRADPYPETFVARNDAVAMARRGFWRGIFCGAVAVALLFCIAAVLR